MYSGNSQKNILTWASDYFGIQMITFEMVFTILFSIVALLLIISNLYNKYKR